MTAVEYLEEIIYGDKKFSLSEVFEQAKEMEKQQCLKMLPYDLDELVKGFIERTGYNDFDSYSYKLGFQKALELLTFKSE